MVLAVPPPPMAWYGSSFAYAEWNTLSEHELDANAELARAGRLAAFAPEQFGSRPGGGAGSGVVLGRFLPVHDGHRYLLEFARAHVADLHVFVRVTAADPVPWPVRRQWLAELFPDVEVTALEDEPGDRWTEQIHARVRPDFLFTGEADGPELARRLGARLVPVDRAEIPVSGAKVRADPWAFERYLPPPVRAWYARRVCLIGPEGSAKTSIAARLAEHYGTVYVREQLRTGAPAGVRPADVSLAAYGQKVAEDLLARRASRVLICDTDVLSVRLWSERLFGTAPDWVREAADSSGADLYLLTAPDLPFTGPQERDQPAERRQFHADCERELVRLGHRHVAIDGDHDRRFAQAVAAVDALLAQPSR